MKMKSFLAGAIIGGIASGVAVALTTPKKGVELREDIKKESEKVTKLAEEKANSYKEDALKKVDEYKEKITTYKEGFEEKANSYKENIFDKKNESLSEEEGHTLQTKVDEMFNENDTSMDSEFDISQAIDDLEKKIK